MRMGSGIDRSRNRCHCSWLLFVMSGFLSCSLRSIGGHGNGHGNGNRSRIRLRWRWYTRLSIGTGCSLNLFGGSVRVDNATIGIPRLGKFVCRILLAKSKGVTMGIVQLGTCLAY